MAAAPNDIRPAVDYVPRPQFLPFHNRGNRWAVIVAHRRAGKTVACIMELLTRALATSKKDARYAYIAPYREQAKTVAWAYLKHYAANIVKDQAKDLRESDLQVRLFNGSTVRLFGADNPNALRGMYLDGVVLDEYADMRPALWGEVIRPTLSDRQGWAVFIGTPRGKNAFWEIYDKAQSDPNWFKLTLKASETGLLPEAELADARRTMSENQYEQEYECSFEAAIIGAIYAKELKAAESRITAVPYDGSLLVHTAWDIGIGDSTAIWFFQVSGQQIRVIDYFEDSGQPAPYYASVLKGRGYRYDTAWMPHDAFNKQSATGLTFSEVVRDNGFHVEQVAKISPESGINAARMLFPRLMFDKDKCAAGLEALRAYRWGYNQHMGELRNEPVHDWASHGADAFRYLAVSRQKAIGERMSTAPLKYPSRAYV